MHHSAPLTIVLKDSRRSPYLSWSTVLSETLEPIFPSWLVRLDAPPSSRDPLGLAAEALENADRLLPGLSVFTSRARYYSFVCWAIAAAEQGRPEGHLDRVHRLERLLVLCESLWHREDDEEGGPRCSYVGRRRGRAFVREGRGAGLWQLPTRVLKNQGSNGALRLYRASLLDLGLVEEDEESALGIVLTSTGSQLADYYGRRVDGSVVQWALDEAASKKQIGTLDGLAESMCLSSRMAAVERKRLVAALFGTEEHGLLRRETVQTLFRHGLLAAADTRPDVASDDEDEVTADGGKKASTNETLGNAEVVRHALEHGPGSDLASIHRVAAFEAGALGLNAIVASILAALSDTGRVSVEAWLRGIDAEGTNGFREGRLKTWAERTTLTDWFDQALEPRNPAHGAVAGLGLLTRAAFDKTLREALTNARTEVLLGTLERLPALADVSPRQVLLDLVPDLTRRHLGVSARKAKKEWWVLDGSDLVRQDQRLLWPYLHSLRFAQLRQLASDLQLKPEDVVDDA